ncbi:MAG: methylenetetrahydrofolate reductase [Limnochordaceae bacterium]|nr:methylenetetrahydrofolate reductase [Limnochordaceae bacterium]
MDLVEAEDSGLGGPLAVALRSRRRVITMEWDPPAGADADKALDDLSSLLGRPAIQGEGRPAQVDSPSLRLAGINVTDGPMASLRMSPLVFGHLLQQEVGVQAICHVTCRDRNLLGLQSELLGAHALGIRALLALGGDPPHVFQRFPRPGLAGVYHTDVRGLLELVTHLNQGQDAWGQPLTGPTRFLVGAAINPGAGWDSWQTGDEPVRPEKLEAEVAKARAKMLAGATFFQTQPVFSVRVWLRFREALQAAGVDVPVIVGLWPLRDARQAHYLQSEVPGTYLPAGLTDRLERGGRREGERILAELAAELAPTVAGFHLFPRNRIAVARRSLELLVQSLEAVDAC